MADWRWEGRVQAAIAKSLQDHGWTDLVVANTESQARGVGIEVLGNRSSP